MITDTEAQAAADRAEEDMERLIEDAKKWRNAMQGGQKCGNCRFWKISALSEDGECFEFNYGDCRRYPPKLIPYENLTTFTSEDKSFCEFHQGSFPQGYRHPVSSDCDWCGEWQPAQQNLTNERAIDITPSPSTL